MTKKEGWNVRKLWTITIFLFVLYHCGYFFPYSTIITKPCVFLVDGVVQNDWLWLQSGLRFYCTCVVSHWRVWLSSSFKTIQGFKQVCAWWRSLIFYEDNRRLSDDWLRFHCACVTLIHLSCHDDVSDASCPNTSSVVTEVGANVIIRSAV